MGDVEVNPVKEKAGWGARHPGSCDSNAHCIRSKMAPESTGETEERN